MKNISSMKALDHLEETSDSLTQQITIRDFTDADINAFIGLGKYLQENGNYADCGFDIRKVVTLFAQIRTNPESYFGVIAEAEDGTVVGAFMAVMQDYYFSNERFAMDLGFGLLPDYRQSAQQVMAEMIDKYEAWAKERGAHEVMISTSAGMHGNKLLPFLNSIEFNTVGFIAKKRIS
jgi:hypothetical protein